MFFLSSDGAFYDLFDRAANNIVYTAELFLEMLRNFELRKDFAKKIREAERTGDNITHETITKLDQTFITPIDREDIHSLISNCDDVVDYLDAAAQRLVLYGVTSPTEDIVKQAQVAVQIARCLGAAIREVRNMRNQEKLSKLLIDINDWENRGDEHTHAALARLFETNNPMYVLKWKELYELVETAIDSCERVAHILRSIMVKNA
jgi:predicted phosphate transport protein (TIGR00153 family)